MSSAVPVLMFSVGRSRVSVRAVLAAAAVGATVLVWLMAALATLSVQRASDHLGDAGNSHEQLAIINRLEAEFGRLLLAETEALASPGTASEPAAPDSEAVEILFRRLLVLIDEDCERHGDTRDDQVRKIRKAEAMRRMFAQLHLHLDQPANASRRSDPADAVRAFFEDTVRADTAGLDRLVRAASTNA